MAENFIESEVITDRGVDSINLKVDAAQLTAFQDTLKGPQARGMNAFITKLNELQALNAQAEAIRRKQETAGGAEAPQVNGVSIPVENRDPVLTAHNEKIRAIHQAIQEFNASRAEFLNSFIIRYIAPRPAREEPRVWQRVAQRTGPDYFAYMRDRTPDPLTPEQMADARYLAYLESPDAKKFDAMSDDEVSKTLAGFRTQWLGKAVSKYEWMPDREILKRVMYDMKTGSVGWQVEAGLRMMAQYLLKK